MGKHAYMIVSNGNLKVLERCVQLIDDYRNDIYILFDKKSNITITERETIISAVKMSGILILDDRIVNWGGTPKLMRF